MQRGGRRRAWKGRGEVSRGGRGRESPALAEESCMISGGTIKRKKKRKVGVGGSRSLALHDARDAHARTHAHAYAHTHTRAHAHMDAGTDARPHARTYTDGCEMSRPSRTTIQGAHLVFALVPLHNLFKERLAPLLPQQHAPFDAWPRALHTQPLGTDTGPVELGLSAPGC